MAYELLERLDAVHLSLDDPMTGVVDDALDTTSDSKHGSVSPADDDRPAGSRRPKQFGAASKRGRQADGADRETQAAMAPTRKIAPEVPPVLVMPLALEFTAAVVGHVLELLFSQVLFARGQIPGRLDQLQAYVDGFLASKGRRLGSGAGKRAAKCLASATPIMQFLRDLPDSHVHMVTFALGSTVLRPKELYHVHFLGSDTAKPCPQFTQQLQGAVTRKLSRLLFEQGFFMPEPGKPTKTFVLVLADAAWEPPESVIPRRNIDMLSRSMTRAKTSHFVVHNEGIDVVPDDDDDLRRAVVCPNDSVSWFQFSQPVFGCTISQPAIQS